MDKQKKILCIGEVLWDSLPSGLYLGGAPLNVCYHLNQFGLDATIASRVGNDRLGQEAIRRIKGLGIPVELIQQDDQLETGFVGVELSQNGDPRYNIVEPVAWDQIKVTEELQKKASESWGLVFGSLAQRNKVSRQSIQKLWKGDTMLIFDMNLREPFINQDVIYNSLTMANVVKMNEEELNYLIEWLGLSGSSRSAVEDLVKEFECSTVCITKGANGSMLFYEGQWFEHTGFPVKAKDVVGAGDAFLASLLHGISKGKPGKEMLACANATGSLIAQKDGATPGYDLNEVMNEIV